MGVIYEPLRQVGAVAIAPTVGDREEMEMIQVRAMAVRPRVGHACLIAFSLLLAGCARGNLPDRWWCYGQQGGWQMPPVAPSSDRLTPPDTIFKATDKIIALHGYSCAISDNDGTQNVVRIQDSVDFNDMKLGFPKATQATVILNGWRFQYLNTDRYVQYIGAAITQPSFENGVIKWEALGVIADENFDDPYEFCHYYTVVGWNDAKVLAAPFEPVNDTICMDHPSDVSPAEWPRTIPLWRKPATLEHASFAAVPRVAIVPRAFGFINDDDHELFQLAYNLDHSEQLRETFNQKEITTEASKFGSQFIMRDDRFREYRQGDLFAAVGGADVRVVQPPFSAPSWEPGKYWFCPKNPGERKETNEVQSIENVTFEYAIPMLTGWNLNFGCEDDYVKDIGMYLTNVVWDRDDQAPAGTLSFQVNSILRDLDDKQAAFSDAKVGILGFGLAPQPDLRIADPGTGSLFPYCRRNSGQPFTLVVRVENIGDGTAPPSQAFVEFVGTGTRSALPTPSLKKGQTADVTINMPPACFNPHCRFRIVADGPAAIVESNEDNNQADGQCGV